MEILKFDQFINESHMKEIKAGIAILFNNKILLVHPTNSSWKKGTCGIPKGRMEHGEDSMETAIRELMEETGILVNYSQLDKHPENVDIIDSSGKTSSLIYYVCKIQSLDEIGLTSEKVPSSQLQKSEIDWAKFVSAEEAYPITSRAQLIILDRHLTLDKNK